MLKLIVEPLEPFLTVENHLIEDGYRIQIENRMFMAMACSKVEALKFCKKAIDKMNYELITLKARRKGQ